MSSAPEGVVDLRVRYAETDQMGVVYHANYLVWCEVGRTELMRSLGFAYSELEGRGTMLAVAEASIRYARAARYDDAIRVTTRLQSVQSRTITFTYDIVRSDDGTLLARASTKLVSIDKSGVPCRLPPDLIARFHETAAAP